MQETESRVSGNCQVRAYDQLTRQGIVFTRRGMGYFVSENARDIIMENRRKEFMEEKLPDLFRQMRLLGISIETIDRLWKG